MASGTQPAAPAPSFGWGATPVPEVATSAGTVIARQVRRWSGTKIACAIASYAALGAFAYLRAWIGGPGHTSQFAGGDIALNQWMLGWAAHAVTHGANPFVSNWADYPAGVNVAANTNVLGMGVLLAPLTLTIGPVATLTVAFVLSFAASASAMFLVLRRWTEWEWAAYLGGLLYGFSPYMVGQGLGHLHLAAAPVPPLVLWLFARVLENRDPLRDAPRRVGPLLGAAVVLQFFLSTEVLASTALVALVALGILAALRRSDARSGARRVLATTGWAAAVAVPLLAYPLWEWLRGAQHVTGAAQLPSFLAQLRAHVAGFVLPGSNQLLTGGSLRHTADSFVHVGNQVSVAENGTYVGVPLLVLTAVLAWRYRRCALVSTSALAALACALAELGNRLALGAGVTSIPLPFAVLYHLPLLDSLVGVRFSLFVFGFLAVIIAIGTSSLHGELTESMGRRRHSRASLRARRRRVLLPGVLAACALVPLVPRFPYTMVQDRIPRLFSDHALSSSTIPAGAVVLTYPYPYYPENVAMTWQAVSGFRFRLASGYFIVPAHDAGAAAVATVGRDGGVFSPTPSVIGTALQHFYNSSGSAPPAGDVVFAARNELRSWHVSVVVAADQGADPLGAVRFLSAVVGSPPRTVGGVVVWHTGVP